MLDVFLKKLQLERIYHRKEENKMYGQSPCTLINEFVHRLFCEFKIPSSLITQQEFFGK